MYSKYRYCKKFNRELSKITSRIIAVAVAVCHKPSTPKPEAKVSVLGVTDAKNLKNLGMYGLLTGTFEARHKSQASGSRLTLAYFQQHLLL